jgi:hypothetical protein
MPIIIVNPFDETPHNRAAAAGRLATLAGRKVALLDISKPGGSIFLDRIETLLKDRYGVGHVMRVMKPTFSKPAPEDVIDRIASEKVDAVIEALAD